MKKPVKAIIACAACAAAVGLGAYAVFLNRSGNTVPTFSEITEAQIKNTTEPTTVSEDWRGKYGYNPSETGITAKAQSLLRVNKDVIGWIKIDDTQVDYPLFLDPGEIQADTPFYGTEHYDPNYFYLDHDMYGRYAREGSLYIDYRDRFTADEDDQSENIVIYGHNMANNTMFGSIRRYRQDYEFYKTSPFIKLSSNYRDYDYVIFAFFITSGTFDETDFPYWNMEDLDNEKDFNFYIDCCRRNQMIDTGVDVQYGDKLVTLSTCYADEDNSRFLIVGRRLREGEVAGDLDSVTHTEAYIKAQEEAKKAAEEEAAKKKAEEEAASKTAAEAAAAEGATEGASEGAAAEGATTAAPAETTAAPAQ